MLLDPFTDDPFIILGLPLYVTSADIVRKWKELMLKNHPDKNWGSERSTIWTKIYNEAKERAIKMLTDPACRMARLNTARRNDEFERRCAEVKQAMYVGTWTEQNPMKEPAVAKPPKKKRKHTKMWVGDKYDGWKVLISEFVQEHTKLEEKSFVSCSAFLHEFTAKHKISDLDRGFFFKTLKGEINKKYDKTQWQARMGADDRGYKGIMFTN